MSDSTFLLAQQCRYWHGYWIHYASISGVSDLARPAPLQ